MRPAIGIDLGGTRIKALAYDLDAEQEIETRLPLTRDGEQVNGLPAWASTVRTLVAEWEAQWGRPAEVIGIATPGLAASDGASVACLPAKLEGIENFSWTQHLDRKDRVTVLNDAHAALEAQQNKQARARPRLTEPAEAVPRSLLASPLRPPPGARGHRRSHSTRSCSAHSRARRSSSASSPSRSTTSASLMRHSTPSNSYCTTTRAG